MAIQLNNKQSESCKFDYKKTCSIRITDIFTNRRFKLQLSENVIERMLTRRMLIYKL